MDATLKKHYREKNQIEYTWKRIATLVGGIPHSAKIVIA